MMDCRHGSLFHIFIILDLTKNSKRFKGIVTVQSNYYRLVGFIRNTKENYR